MPIALMDLFGLDRKEGMEIGAGPGHVGQVVRVHPKTGERHLDWLTWGLLPHETRDPERALRPIHARAETVADTPMFADAFRSRRGIAAAGEYYQMRSVKGVEKRYTISRGDGLPMAMAAV